MGKKADKLAAQAAIAQPDDHKIVILTKGARALVSNDDYDAVLARMWCALPNHSGGYYAVRAAKGATVYLHRFIMSRVLGRDLARDEHIDHKDQGTLDNRRENLRISSAAENRRNGRRHADGQWEHKGVVRFKLGRAFYTIITVGSFATRARAENAVRAHEPLIARARGMLPKNARVLGGRGWHVSYARGNKNPYQAAIRIGGFPDPLSAARAYDVMAPVLHGEFALLNFPNDASLITRAIDIASAEPAPAIRAPDLTPEPAMS